MDVEPSSWLPRRQQQQQQPTATCPRLKVRLQLKGRLEEAFRSGSLDEAVRKAIEGEVAPEAEAEAAEAPMDDVVKLQMQLRAVMLDAVESLGIVNFQEI